MNSLEKTLEISHIEDSTTLLGPYNRCVIWVHGCCFNCPGCLADNTKNGLFTAETIQTLAERIDSLDVEGITISGGEPFLQAESLTALITELRKRKDLGVIVYSGFTLSQIMSDPIKSTLLPCIDVLIDGKYVKELDDGRAYIGSSNQKIHYLTNRYEGIGKEYYAAKKRKVEIKMTENKLILVGVPSADSLKIWEKLKEKNGGIAYDL